MILAIIFLITDLFMVGIAYAVYGRTAWLFPLRAELFRPTVYCFIKVGNAPLSS